MTDCDHIYELESIETPEGSEGTSAPRTAWLKCVICGKRQGRITRRSDAQINAELAAQ